MEANCNPDPGNLLLQIEDLSSFARKAAQPPYVLVKRMPVRKQWMPDEGTYLELEKDWL